MTLRAVFDTNVVLSALVFRSGELAWLRSHWAANQARPLASAESIAELIKVLAYPKFELTADEIQERLGHYLPHVEVVEAGPATTAAQCRDPDDRKFVALALSGKADVLVTGDRDLLALRGDVPFSIDTPAEYRRRFPTSSGDPAPKRGSIR